MEYKNILVEKEEGVALIKINRPKALNAINREVLNELINVFQELGEDENIKVIILSGEGKAFVAGADIKEMINMSPTEARKFSETGHNLMGIMEKLGKPIIAAVNGFALGGGMEIAMACEVRDMTAETVTGRILTAKHIYAHNTFAQPESVKPSPFTDARLEKDRVSVKLPPKAVMVLELS